MYVLPPVAWFRWQLAQLESSAGPLARGSTVDVPIWKSASANIWLSGLGPIAHTEAVYVPGASAAMGLRVYATVPSGWIVMFAFGTPPSASGLRPCAMNGPAGWKFSRLYAVTVCRGDRGPTTKKSAVEPRLAGETVCPQASAKVMVTTGRSPTRKKLPFVGVETATVVVRPPG